MKTVVCFVPKSDKKRVKNTTIQAKEPKIYKNCHSKLASGWPKTFTPRIYPFYVKIKIRRCNVPTNASFIFQKLNFIARKMANKKHLTHERSYCRPKLHLINSKLAKATPAQRTGTSTGLIQLSVASKDPLQRREWTLEFG